MKHKELILEYAPYITDDNSKPDIWRIYSPRYKDVEDFVGKMMLDIKNVKDFKITAETVSKRIKELAVESENLEKQRDELNKKINIVKKNYLWAKAVFDAMVPLIVHLPENEE